MKSTIKITKLLLCSVLLLACNTASEAQLDHEILLRVNSPSAVAGDYEFGSPALDAGNAATQWGPTSISTITGDLMWIDDNTDSLGCFPATNTLSGKIALIRRGDCMFSLKAYYAQAMGAVGCVICNHTPNDGLVGMLGGDSMSAVTIPSAFITYEDCELWRANIDTGGTTSVSFYVPTTYEARSAYAYNTPVQHIQSFSSMSVTIYNTSGTAANNVDVTAHVTDPNGADTTFTQTLSTLNGTTDSTVTFPDTYTPAAIGTYDVVFKSSLNPADSVTQQFLINGDSTFALDNNMLTNNSLLRGIGPGDADYAAAHPVTGATFQYGMGACYITGVGTADYATTATFALENANTYFGKMFLVLLYEAPVNYFAGNETDFSTFNEIGAGFYNITAADTINPHSLMTTSILDASTGAPGLQLQGDRHYMLVLRHDGDNSITTSPKISTTHSRDYLSVDATVYLDQLYMGGWTSKSMPVIRMQVQSTLIGVETKNLSPTEFIVFPNPTDENISVKVNLQEMSEKVSVKLYDLNGKELQSHTYENVQSDIYHYNVCQLPAGVYLMHVQTDFAQTVRKVIVR
jgi:hypothetical protein